MENSAGKRWWLPMEEFQPRSEVLRAAWSRAKQDKTEEPAMLSVAGACRRLGISKWMLYRQMKAGKLASVKVGSRRLIPLRAIAEFIRNLEAEAQASQDG
jgi:excisionase family DNA binding protein